MVGTILHKMVNSKYRNLLLHHMDTEDPLGIGSRVWRFRVLGL